LRHLIYPAVIRRRLGIQWVVVACLLVVLCGGVAIGADTTAEQTDVVTEGGDVVEVQSLATDPRDGEIAEYELTYYLGDDISELTVTVTEASAEPGDGFTEVSDNTYEWDGETEEPVLEVEKEVDQTAGQHDGLDFAGTDDGRSSGRYRPKPSLPELVTSPSTGPLSTNSRGWLEMRWPM